MSADTPLFNMAEQGGPFFFAIFFDAFLYGVLCAQMFTYFTTPKRDATWIRCLVALVLLTETVHTAFNIASLYIAVIQNYGNYYAVMYASWASQGGPVTTGFVALLVQWFFAWRIHVLTRNWWIVGTIFFFSIIQICGAIGTTIGVHIVPYSPQFYKLRPIIITWCVGAVTADILITGTLVYYLRRRKSGIQFTDRLIDKITRLTIETNLLTFVWNIIDLILYLRITTTMHLVFNLTITKLYSLSLLVSLNSRDAWQRDASDPSVPLELPTDGRLSAHPRASLNVNMLRAKDTPTSKRMPRQIYIGVEAHEMVVVDEEVEVKDVPVDVQRASDSDSWLRDEKTVRTATPATDATSDSDADVERAL